MNNYKLKNLANGTALQDALTVAQDYSLRQGMMYTPSNITSGISFPFVVPCASVYKPVAPTGAPAWVSLGSDGVLVAAV